MKERTMRRRANSLRILLVGIIAVLASFGLGGRTTVNASPRDDYGAGLGNFSPDGIGAEALSQHLIDRNYSTGNIVHSLAQSQLMLRDNTEVHAMNAVASGSAKMDLSFHSIDLSTQFGAAISHSGNYPVAEATQFFHARYLETAQFELNRGFKTNSLADACGFLVDSLYLAGEGIVASVSQRKLFQSACIFDFARYLSMNRPIAMNTRDSYGSSQALLGSVFRYAAINHQRGTAASAQAFFKRLTGQDMTSVPVGNFNLHEFASSKRPQLPASHRECYGASRQHSSSGPDDSSMIYDIASA